MKFIAMVRDTNNNYYDHPIIIDSDTEENAEEKINKVLKKDSSLGQDDADFILTYILSEEELATI